MSRRGRGAVGWGMGRDSASSAQSKHVSRGDTARLRSSWGELGRMGNEQGVGGERGASVGADSVVGDAGGVYQTDDTETARLRGVWGELGGWNAFRGCSEGSSSVSRRFWVVVCGSEWDRVGNSAVIDKRVDDNAAVMSCSSGRTTGS
jgi:hypothetical protein